MYSANLCVLVAGIGLIGFAGEAAPAAHRSGTDSQGVFVSENAGISWAARRTGLPELSQVFDLAAVGDTIFAGLYSKGLYRWDAGRGMWVKSGDVAPLELV